MTNELATLERADSGDPIRFELEPRDDGTLLRATHFPFDMDAFAVLRRRHAKEGLASAADPQA